MKELLGLNLEELKREMQNIGEKPYRAGQVVKWLMRGNAFDEMTNLSKELRVKLAENFREGYITEKSVLTSADGTKKFLFELYDGNTVESVFMQKNYGNTACISTQVGCRMGCRFCASGEGGFVRDLSPGEMLAQVVGMNAHMGELAADHIVLMGMGEPLDNYDNVAQFLRLVTDGQFLGLGARGISLSTCGIVEGIYRLAEEGLPITLCLSLHAADDKKRQEIMPTAKVYKIDDILAAAKQYFNRMGRRIIIEYTVMDGFNNTLADAEKLKALLKGLNCHVNIIPVNEKQEEGKIMDGRKAAYRFCADLEKLGISATVRMSLGGDIMGACGQLRQRSMQGK